MVALGVVGSRDYNNFDVVEKHILSLNLDIDRIVSGGAKGVDSLAEQFAQKHGVELTVYNAEWDKHGKSAGPLRNTKIVDAIDYLIAFPSKKSVGTFDSINKGKKKGIPVKVMYVD